MAFAQAIAKIGQRMVRIHNDDAYQNGRVSRGKSVLKQWMI